MGIQLCLAERGQTHAEGMNAINIEIIERDEDPTFFSTDLDPTGKKYGSGSDLKAT